MRQNGIKGWAGIEVDRIRASGIRSGVWADIRDDEMAMQLLLIREFSTQTCRGADPIESYAATLALYEMGFLQTEEQGEGFALLHAFPEETGRKRPIWDGRRVVKPIGYPNRMP